MNSVERMFLECMDSENFSKCVDDDFSFVDLLVDASDLEKIRERDEAKEEITDGIGV